MAYTLRLLQTDHEYHECEDIQREAWGFTSDLDIIPLTLLVTAQLHGGLVLGAFDEEGAMQGFCYGILGLEEEPTDLGITRWERAIPQPGRDHVRRLAEVRERLAAQPGLELAGGYVSGVSVADSYASGLAASAALA